MCLGAFGLKTALLDTTNETCGKTKKMASQKGKPGGGMMKLIRLLLKKRWCWKAWKQGGGKEQYLQAKRNVKRTGFTLQRRLLKRRSFQTPKTWDGMASSKLQNNREKDNHNVVGDKCVKDDSHNLSLDNEAKKVAWKTTL